ncbi:hypothetical protein [Actinoplanes sp. NPDC020271]|uniref:hypothetical protein n=1 Tax=Actinoplanes sp. NPDC020271 TaxID=3363896 RepID=UPI0037911CAD
MIDPVWHVASLDHLKLMFQYAQGSLERDARRNISMGFPQQLELTLPWGMDDGDAVVRLTLAPAPSEELGKRGLLAVVVFAEAVRFGEQLDPPHYPGRDKPVARPRSVPPLTTSVAEYLREQTDGSPLIAVGDGSVRFVLYRFPA